MNTHPSRRRLLAVAAVGLLVLGGAACSDDGDGGGGGGDEATRTTPTTEAPSSTEESSSTEDDATTPTTDEGEPSTTATTVGVPGDRGPLADRIPDIEGYERNEEDNDDDGFDDELCDGSEPSLDAIEEASVDYNVAGQENAQELLAIGAGRFASPEDAVSFYEEFTSTTAGCNTGQVTVSESTDTGIGDQGQSFEITFASSGAGAVYVSLRGDEVWYLSQFGAAADADVPEVVVDAFRTAVES